MTKSWEETKVRKVFENIKHKKNILLFERQLFHFNDKKWK